MMRSFLLAFVLCAIAATADAAVRIKDVTSLRGARDNQLIGYGLVVGLQSTGDSLRNAAFTEQAIQSMLDRMGLNVRSASLRNRNVAAVIVTADFPMGMDAGQRLDVTVSALGDATSLMGGTLLLTQLSGTDGQVYASAQGAVSVTGFDAAGQATVVTQGVPTVGRIPNGAIVETGVAAADRRIADVSRAPQSRLRDGGADHRRDQRLSRVDNIAGTSRLSATGGRSSCFVRGTSASPA